MSRTFFPNNPTFAFIPVTTRPDRREFIDANNQLQNSRYINPKTGDYQLSKDGHFVGMSGIQQQVYLAIATQYNSSAQPNFGQQFTQMKVRTPNTDQQAADFVNQTLSLLTSAGKISINNIQIVDISPGQMGIAITWTDLTSQQAPQTTTVGFQPLSNQPVIILWVSPFLSSNLLALS